MQNKDILESLTVEDDDAYVRCSKDSKYSYQKVVAVLALVSGMAGVYGYTRNSTAAPAQLLGEPQSDITDLVYNSRNKSKNILCYDRIPTCKQHVFGKEQKEIDAWTKETFDKTSANYQCAGRDLTTKDNFTWQQKSILRDEKLPLIDLCCETCTGVPYTSGNGQCTDSEERFTGQDDFFGNFVGTLVCPSLVELSGTKRGCHGAEDSSIPPLVEFVKRVGKPLKEACCKSCNSELLPEFVPYKCTDNISAPPGLCAKAEKNGCDFKEKPEFDRYVLKMACCACGKK